MSNISNLIKSRETNIGIKYPIAFHKQTESLVNISDVTDDNNRELICFECKGNFIAVRKHQTPHFKHKPNSKCEGNVESYIHWLTKEVFKEITEMEIPEICKDDLTFNQREKLDNQVNRLIEKHVPENLQRKFMNDIKGNISESGIFQIEKTETEKVFKTSLGDIRIDIVTTINNQNLFIEPFHTSPIVNLKKQKLTLTNTPTLSISLVPFIIKYNKYSYSLEDLKNYLISKDSKAWVFIRENRIEEYVEKYLEYVNAEIIKNKSVFDINNSKLKKISELNGKEINFKEKSYYYKKR